MTEHSDRFLNAISEIEAVADAVPADDAHDHFDSTTLQVFWRDWPHISAWAGSLWRRLSEDLEQPATAGTDDHEVGGEGGG